MYERKEDTKFKENAATMMIVDWKTREVAKALLARDKAIHLTIIFYLPAPKRKNVKVRKAHEKDHHFLCDKKPDLDNLEKSIMDTMEGIFYENDSRVASKYTVKVYTREEPRIDVHIAALPDRIPIEDLAASIRGFARWAEEKPTLNDP